ncbi:hypothetical protein OSTOST_16889 [Ostertagia ostertagi]
MVSFHVWMTYPTALYRYVPALHFPKDKLKNTSVGEIFLIKF